MNLYTSLTDNTRLWKEFKLPKGQDYQERFVKTYNSSAFHLPTCKVKGWHTQCCTESTLHMLVYYVKFA